MHVNFIKYKWLYFGISLLVLIPGVFSLIKYGLRLSIDFTGGTLLEISNIQSPISNIQDLAKKQDLELSSIQPSQDNTYLLRFKQLDKDQNEKFKSALGKDVVEKRFESVGPVVGAEMAKKALLAVILASLAIILYIAWSFRQIPRPYSPWKFGISAVVALLHDALVVLGLFSLFGHFYQVEIDALFVTALLTVIGFSVHDTIVVFDRVRENLPKMYNKPFPEIVDFSLILTLTALLLFGGETIRWFVVALLVGIVSGTYSSIFNAAPLLVLWESRKK
ncbi:MAG: Protein translocase subunit SecF [Candidatus Amesbacteria bacterium GW2011_GWB1_47_26]|nr:MAG: Protein translocase subunit SecF [Candidatus Amesbacteria bacterium GW2011_GWB1_47_26]